MSPLDDICVAETVPDQRTSPQAIGLGTTPMSYLPKQQKDEQDDGHEALGPGLRIMPYNG